MPHRRPLLEPLEGRRLMHGEVDLLVNFQPKRVPTPAGAVPDVGLAYGERADGLVYGWARENWRNHRDRNLLSDQRLDTVAGLQTGGNNQWEIEVPNGDYSVTVTAGDAKYFDSVYVIAAENSRVVKGTPTSSSRFLTKTRTVTVSDGRLTIRPSSGASNAKINSVRIESVHGDSGHEEPPPVVPPTVAATVVDGSATEGDANDSGSIRLTRAGTNLSGELAVAIAWSGSADDDDVTSARPTTATFASGQTVIDLPVVAAADDLEESDETATLTILAGDAYSIGDPSQAMVTIVDATEEPEPPPPDESFSNITWSSTSAPPISFSETTSATVSGKIYLFGGFNATFSPQKKVYAFDGTTWQTKNDSPVAFTHVGHAAVGDSVWFVGGYIGTSGGGQTFGTDVVRIYNTTSDTWSTGPALPQRRSAGNLVKVGRSLYYFGGESFNRVADTTEMWALDLDDQSAGWVSKASMTLPRNHASAMNIDDKIYVIAGQTGFDDNLTAHDDIQIYDPADDSWTVRSEKLPGVRSHTTNSAFYYRDRIILIGGETDHNAPVSDVWSIDPTTLVTTALGNFPDARFSAATGVIDDKIYAFGGYRGFIPTSAYKGTFVTT